MIDGVGMHGLDDRDLVGDLAGVRQQFAQPHARRAMLLELEDRRRGRKGGLIRGHAGQALAHPHRFRQIAAAQLLKPGLVIEQVQLRGSAVLEQINDALGARREMRQSGQPRAGAQIRREQGSEGGRAQPGARAAKKMPPRQQVLSLVDWIHGPIPS